MHINFFPSSIFFFRLVLAQILAQDLLRKETLSGIPIDNDREGNSKNTMHDGLSNIRKNFHGGKEYSYYCNG